MLDRYGAGGLTADKDDEDEPMSSKAESLVDRAVAGTPVDELVGELILGVQTPPPPMTDKERKKKRMGAGIEPESNKATYYPLDPGSQGWFET